MPPIRVLCCLLLSVRRATGIVLCLGALVLSRADVPRGGVNMFPAPICATRFPSQKSSSAASAASAAALKTASTVAEDVHWAPSLQGTAAVNEAWHMQNNGCDGPALSRAHVAQIAHSGPQPRPPSDDCELPRGIERLGLVTWNVNGLLPCLKRMSLKSLEELLETFGPEVSIVCVQETKMQRSQLDQSLARPKGWDAFYSFSALPPSKVHGYSGTATFVRSDRCRPIDALEGFSSLCCTGEISEIVKRLEVFGDGTAAPTKAGGTQGDHEESPVSRTGPECEMAVVEDVDGGGLLQLLCETTPDQLRALDSEGRCVMTDHGDFVLFNVYFPAVRSKDKFEFQLDQERYIFKLRFNLALHQAIASLRAKGRRVVLVGDLNISLKRDDSCDPSDDFDTSPSRLWLRSLLKDQQLEDLFRSFHPHDKQVYTCWNQQTGARLTNYGTRIDYVLADKAMVGRRDGVERRDGVRFVECKIQGYQGSHEKGSDHSPVLAWLTGESTASNLRLPSASWWSQSGRADRPEECGQGPGRLQPPAMCATFFPEARRKQTSIESMFANAVQRAPEASSECSEGCDTHHPRAPRHEDDSRAGAARVGGQTMTMAPAQKAGDAAGKKSKTSFSKEAAARQRQEEKAGAHSASSEQWSELSYRGRPPSGTATGSLMSFFTLKDGINPVPATTSPALQEATPEAEAETPQGGGHANVGGGGQKADGASNDIKSFMGHRTGNLDAEGTLGKRRQAEASHATAAAQWGKILCMKKSKSANRPPAVAPKYLSEKEQKAFLATAAEAPLCPGHGEPAIQRIVQKPGSNQGKRFWVSAQPCLSGVLAAHDFLLSPCTHIFKLFSAFTRLRLCTFLCARTLDDACVCT